MPSDMVSDILRRWTAAGHGQTFNADRFLSRMARLMMQQKEEDRVIFPDGLDVFVVNTTGVPFGAKGYIVRNGTCPGMGKLFVSLYGQPLGPKQVPVNKKNILKEEPEFYQTFAPTSSPFWCGLR